jgi:hypothetical protein
MKERLSMKKLNYIIYLLGLCVGFLFSLTFFKNIFLKVSSNVFNLSEVNLLALTSTFESFFYLLGLFTFLLMGYLFYIVKSIDQTAKEVFQLKKNIQENSKVFSQSLLDTSRVLGGFFEKHHNHLRAMIMGQEKMKAPLDSHKEQLRQLLENLKLFRQNTEDLETEEKNSQFLNKESEWEEVLKKSTTQFCQNLMEHFQSLILKTQIQSFNVLMELDGDSNSQINPQFIKDYGVQMDQVISQCQNLMGQLNQVRNEEFQQFNVMWEKIEEERKYFNEKEQSYQKIFQNILTISKEIFQGPNLLSQLWENEKKFSQLVYNDKVEKESFDLIEQLRDLSFKIKSQVSLPNDMIETNEISEVKNTNKTNKTNETKMQLNNAVGKISQTQNNNFVLQEEEHILKGYSARDFSQPIELSLTSGGSLVKNE